MGGKICLKIEYIIFFMNEQRIPRAEQEPEKTNHKLEPAWAFFPLPDGRLIVDNFGDLNGDPAFTPAYDMVPETGKTLMETYLDVERDEGGKIIKARIKDERAYSDYVKKKFEARQRGSAMATKIVNGALERLSGESIKRRKKAENLVKPDEDMDLGKFTELLTGLIDEDRWTRDQIQGWKLITWKSKTAKEPVFKLMADFYGGKTKDFVGTYDEIMEQLNNELDRIEEFERGEVSEK